MIKLSIAILVVSVAVMAVMIFQAVRQELDLRNLKARMSENTAEVDRKEEAISEVKSKVARLKTTLTDFNVKMDELKKAKAVAEKSISDFDKSLQACNNEKAKALTKKSGIEDTLSKLKVNQDAAEVAAMEEIQSLKKQIEDRDRAICAFADMSKQEARDLCASFAT